MCLWNTIKANDSHRYIKYLFLLLAIFSCTNTDAQDRHYWSQMGGITAGLLGGSAIAGLKDNSTLYYNAAAMSFANNPSISVGANTYRLRLLNIDNAFGEDLNQFNSGFVVNPDLIGGLLFSKKNDRLRFGYSIATKFLFDHNSSSQVVNETASGETQVGNFDIRNKLQETWVNSAVSYKATQNLAFGFTLIVAIRSQTYSNYIGAQLIPAIALLDASRFDSHIVYNYWNVKSLARISLALDYERFRFGWNATLPSLNLFGNAYLKREFSLVNNPSVQNQLPTSIISTGSDKEMPTTHKYPFSSAVGVSFKLKNKDWIHFSSEFFLSIKKYEVFSSDLEPVTFPVEVLDSINNKYFSEVKFLELSEQAKSILNFSVGYESFLTENWGILAGFRTDFNFNSTDNFDLGELRPYYSTWDIYYVSGGVWGIIKDQKITSGIEIGITPNTTMRQLVNFDDIDSPDYPLMGSPQNTAIANQLIFRLFLGIEIDFIRN